MILIYAFLILYIFNNISGILNFEIEICLNSISLSYNFISSRFTKYSIVFYKKV